MTCSPYLYGCSYAYRFPASSSSKHNLLRYVLSTVDPYVFLLIIFSIRRGFTILIKIQFPKRACHTNAKIQHYILVLPLGISGLGCRILNSLYAVYTGVELQCCYTITYLR